MSKNEPPPAEGSTAAGTDLRELLSGRGGGRSTTTTVILCLVLVALGLLGGIFIGHHFGQPASAATGNGAPGFGQGGFPGGFGNGNGNGGANGNGNGNGTAPSFPGNGQFQLGTITSIDGNTITLKTRTGTTIKVNVGSRTDIQITKSGSIGDLSNGDSIVVVGSRSSDGTIAATRISEGGGFAGGGLPGPGLSPGANGG